MAPPPFAYRQLVRCFSGLYNCRWSEGGGTPVRPGNSCCSKAESIFFVVLMVTFGLAMTFLYLWVFAENDYNEIEWLSYKHFGFWYSWSVILLGLSAFFFSYVAALLLLALCLLCRRRNLHMHIAHKIGTLLCLIAAISALIILSEVLTREWMTVLLSFQITAPYLHVGAVCLMTLLAWPIIQHVVNMEKSLLKALVMLAYFAPLVCLYLVPLGHYSPCIKDSRDLGRRPAILGRKGAPMFAPENSMMSFEKAVEQGTDGLETDVGISLDGVPFLMNDWTLQRTTNVEEVYPKKADLPSAMLTWAQLQRLNAGSWFLSQNPFGTVSSLSAEEQQRVSEQKIVSLEAFLKFAAWTGQLVIFDLFQPPAQHPDTNRYIWTVQKVIHKSLIPRSKILWLHANMRKDVVARYPDLQQTSRDLLPMDELKKLKIVWLSLHYTNMSEELVRDYAAANISINLYVVSQPWLYSLAWCCGVQSVTSNAPHLLRNVKAPVMLISPKEYVQMWVFTDTISASFVFIIFLFYWCHKKDEEFEFEIASSLALSTTIESPLSESVQSLKLPSKLESSSYTPDDLATLDDQSTSDGKATTDGKATPDATSMALLNKA